ncbi:MAG: RNA methyltransferase, partial [Deltaproteobacteria bacterium]|nr:RNA methyltransferase [Deltaproteobacteria bacterium]
MVDEWIHRYRPYDVICALEPTLTEERRARIERVLAERLSGLTVVIENLHDPHNGAAALRSVEACGLCELHVVEASEPFRFSARVSQGCEKWVSIRRHADFARCAKELHERGFALYAAVPGAERTLHELDVSRPAALVFGNEHAGLTQSAVEACDGTFGIPMHGFTQSLNLSVSVAISVFDCAKRRRLALGREGDLPAEHELRLRARFCALSLDERAAEGLVA